MGTTLRILRVLMLVASASLVIYSIHIRPGIEYVVLTLLVALLGNLFTFKVTAWSLEEMEEFYYGEED